MGIDSAPAACPAEGAEDALLVGRFLAGEATAFEALVARYQGAFLRVARRILRDPADAGDAIQVTLVKVFTKLGTYDRGRPFSHWVLRILRNECLNVIRARRPQERLASDVPDASDPLAAFEDAERQRRVRAALGALTRDHREAVVQRYYGERTCQEIAASLGIREQTVRSRLFAARKRLARLLATA